MSINFIVVPFNCNDSIFLYNNDNEKRSRKKKIWDESIEIYSNSDEEYKLEDNDDLFNETDEDEIVIKKDYLYDKRTSNYLFKEWKLKLNELKEYLASHDNKLPPSESILYQWFSGNRSKYHTNTLSDQKMELLKDVIKITGSKGKRNTRKNIKIRRTFEGN